MIDPDARVKLENMVIGAMSRLQEARPSEICVDLAVYGRFSHQAVTAALARAARNGYVGRLPDGRWERLPRNPTASPLKPRRRRRGSP